MKITIPESVQKIIERYNKNGFEAYAVGGCVRDSLLGNDPQDWDITTNASAEETKRCFSDCHIIETGIKHGTVTVIVDGKPYEITAYRIDGSYSDNRHPDSVAFTSNLNEDLARRDFTMNAIACDGRQIQDPFSGIDDINKKLIRCVGNADTRFSEDALRILRALRFSSLLGFSIEEKTALSVRKNYRLLKNVSSERIFTELKKLLCGGNVYRVLMDFSEVFTFIIPEVQKCVGFDQNNPHHSRSLWDHTAAAVSGVVGEPISRFAALLHDTGKSLTKTTDEKGISHFYGHGEQSVIIAEKVLKRLKSPNSFRNSVVELVALHDKRIGSKRTLKKLMAQCSSEQIARLFSLQRADIMAQSEYMRGEKLARLKEAEQMFSQLLEEELCLGLKDLKINGDDLIKLGIAPGPEIGRILNTLLDSVTDGKIKNEKSLLLLRAQQLRDT